MKISTRGNCVLISIPKGEVEQLGVEQNGFLVEGLNMDGVVFGRRLFVSISAEKKSFSPESFPMEDRHDLDNGIDYEE